jgi:hypothetical protein
MRTDGRVCSRGCDDDHRDEGGEQCEPEQAYQLHRRLLIGAVTRAITPAPSRQLRDRSSPPDSADRARAAP